MRNVEDLKRIGTAKKLLLTIRKRQQSEEGLDEFNTHRSHQNQVKQRKIQSNLQSLCKGINEVMISKKEKILLKAKRQETVESHN